MKKTNSETRLRSAILELEHRQECEMKLFREQLQLSYESVKPANLIISTLQEITESKAIKNNLLNLSVGLLSGYISKTLFEGKTHSPLRKIIGTSLMLGITNAITQNPETVQAIGSVFLKTICGNSNNETRKNAS